jgi:primosomal protein N' (replication factor Y)
MTAPPIARIAVPVPRRQSFDFLVPAPLTVQPGVRVRVPFGGRRLVGVVIGVGTSSELPAARLKPVADVLDTQPVFPAKLLDTLRWAADYYHHPLGEVLATALPVALRRGSQVKPRLPHTYCLTDAGRAFDTAALGRAVVQQRLLALLSTAPSHRLQPEQCHHVSPSWRRAMAVLVEKDLVIIETAPVPQSTPVSQPSSVTLNAAQRDASDAVIASLGGYQSFLLHGITGSGKTEVYLRVAETVIERGQQALVLVPEIALTPQLIERFRQRLDAAVVALHSGLSLSERHQAWWSARSGAAGVVLGTRSAVFTPLQRPGVFIIDEEHDTSYKQQDGFRYHARDLALYRAKLEGIPVILGTATPSLETLTNAANGRHHRLELPARAGSASLPRIHLLDLRRTPTDKGLSTPLITAIRQRIERDEQSLIFLNRRGYAPVLYCCQCHWHAQCPRCDAKLTYHKRRDHLRCHHCGHEAQAPLSCPHCGHASLINLGEGTQRIEEFLGTLFPQATILRIDRDATRQKGRLEETLQRVHQGDVDILVGTQLLAKGHDFPNVTLVAVINADQGLYSVDFRAAEHLFQQIIQVAGRAGRADKPGDVLIQTWYPTHPYFESLLAHDYEGFAEATLMERQQAHYPPYAYFALLRAESTQDRASIAFLDFAREQALQVRQQARSKGVVIMDPVPAPMERRAGRYRAQLLVSATHRRPLHRLLTSWLQRLEQSPRSRKVRWSLDVDPVDLY